MHVFDIFVLIDKIKRLSQSGSNHFCPVLRQSALLIADNPLHLGLFVHMTVLLEVVTARLSKLSAFQSQRSWNRIVNEQKDHLNPNLYCLYDS